jgi:hypothetical protein
MKTFLILIFLIYGKIYSQSVENKNLINVTAEEIDRLKIDQYIYEYSGSFFEDGKNPSFNDDRNFDLKTTLVNPNTEKEVDLPNTHVGDTLKLNPSSIILD